MKILLAITSLLILAQTAKSETVIIHNYSTGESEFHEIIVNDNNISNYNFSTGEYSEIKRTNVNKYREYNYDSNSYKEYKSLGNGKMEIYDYSTGEYQILEKTK